MQQPFGQSTRSASKSGSPKRGETRGRIKDVEFVDEKARSAVIIPSDGAPALSRRNNHADFDARDARSARFRRRAGGDFKPLFSSSWCSAFRARWRCPARVAWDDGTRGRSKHRLVALVAALTIKFPLGPLSTR